ncbi:MAG: sugar transferase [Oscillibacter sp.]|nr:sugar transferase [Oscillibacter sp.]
MLQRFKYSIVTLMKLGVFALCWWTFFGLFGIRHFYLLNFSRTSGITWITFGVVYVLMSRVYGGYDIGKRKSKPIIFALSLTVFVTDLITHLFLCIMNTTVVHGGRFVYEQPLLLLAVFVVQVAAIVVVSYLGNDLYFKINKPLKCLVITQRGEDVELLLRKVGRFKKQYRVEEVSYADDPDIFSRIDRYEGIFIYNLVPSERSGLIDYCYDTKKDIYYSVEISDIVTMRGERVLFDDKSMICSPAKGLTFEQRIVKRAMDLFIASVGIILTSPLMLVTALCIKLEDGGHVFYRQKRATYAGRVFEVIKFRSMREVGTVNRSVTKDDDRITKVGRFIRKFRIDELPQLFNVIKSDMSIVGPRPEMLENVNRYTGELPEFAYRLRAKAGITGMAQIYGKYNTSPKDKLILDLTYIEQYSIWLDIKLILRTILVLLTSDESTEAFDKSGKEGRHGK